MLFECINIDIYKPDDKPCMVDFNIPEKFAYLFVGHWMAGDLGEDRNGTGYDAAKWLVNYCMENGEIDVPDWDIQSANPVGRDNINSLLKNYRKHLNL